ncbi:MAG: alpha/beta fold hydrolase [Hyphomicrobiaceae bacterium]
MTTLRVERMVVESDGGGDAVVCIHGLGGTSNTFQPQMSVLAGKRVVRPDLPCSGRSPLLEKPSVASFAAAVVRMAGLLGIGSCTLVGHSMGTMVCQHIAAEHGSLVRKMVLFGALIEPTGPARDGLRQRARTARAEGLSAIADAVAQGSTAAQTGTRNPAAAAFVRESVLRQDPEGYARTCEALADAYAANTHRIRCPVLLVTGQEDAIAPPSVARMLAERIAGTRVAIVPRCGHWPTIECPEEANAALRGAL